MKKNLVIILVLLLIIIGAYLVIENNRVASNRIDEISVVPPVQPATKLCCIECAGDKCNACSLLGSNAVCTDEIRVCTEQDGDCDTHNCWKGCRELPVS